MSNALKRLLLLGLLTQLATACKDDASSSSGAGAMAGAVAGTMAGTMAGTTAGTIAGTTAGATAGATAGTTAGATAGATGGATMMMGEGTCDSPFTFVEQEDGSFRASGVLANDDIEGSCSTPNMVAEDVVLTFTAPEGGLYDLSTAASFGLDSVLYARTTCEDATTELACNDNFGDDELGEVQSLLTVELEAGETVFVIVDSYSTEMGAEGQAFVVTATKSTASVPTLTAVEGAFDPFSSSLGLRVQGADADGDVTTIIFTLTGAQDPGPYEADFEEIGELTVTGEMFNGVIGIPGDERFAGATSASVYVIDSRGLMSNELEIPLAPPTYLDADAPCSLFDGFNACPEGSVCLNDGLSADYVCTAEENIVSTCPMDQAVIDLNASMLMGSGDNTSSMLTLEGASCGGGGPVDIYSFTADAEGSYTVTVTGVGDMDPLLFVRSHCAYDLPRFELACNDDIDPMAENYNSSVTLTLAAGQTIYAFVDSYDGVYVGAYSISVAAN